MKHPAPKGIAVTYCEPCALLTFADHVNRLTEIPHRYCSHCGKVLGVYLYRLERQVESVAAADNNEASKT